MRNPDSLGDGTFTLTSPEFEDGAQIPRRYTCDGDDVSPPLEWQGAPVGAVTMALLVDDPDARGFVHWVAYDIDASATGGLPADWSRTAEGIGQGENDFGRPGYGGPCPPSGRHRYVFRLLALDARLALSGASRASDVERAAAGHVLGEARLTGTYGPRR